MIYAILNMYFLKKYLKLKVNWKKLLIKPAFCAVIMGIISYPIYKLLLVIGLPMQIAVIIVVPIAAIIYFLVGLGTHTIERSDLLSLPGGHKIVSFLQRG